MRLEEATIALRLCEGAARSGKRLSLGDLLKILRDARSIGRLDEAACNRELTARENRRLDRLYGDLVKRAREFGADDVFHQSDPRGAPIWILFAGDVPAGGAVRQHYTNGVAIY